MSPLEANRSGSDGGLGYALIRASQAWRAEVAAALRPHDVTPTQFFVLVAIHRAAVRGRTPPTQRDIGQRLSMDPNTASQVLRALEQSDLLVRFAHPQDARARALGLTATGRQLTALCARLVRAVNSTFFGALDPEEAIHLRCVLDGLAAAPAGS